MLRWGVANLGVVGALLPLIGADAPAVPSAAGQTRNFHISADGLTIQPGDELTFLRFSGGVKIVGGASVEGELGSTAQRMQVTASGLEVEVASGSISAVKSLRLPKVEEPPERVSDDPGHVAAEMARQLELPKPDFSRSALRRIAAIGGIEMKSRDALLKADGLVSPDGGRSWSASGGCEILMQAKSGNGAQGGTYSIKAQALLFDTQSNRAVAREKVLVLAKLEGGQALEVRAESAEFNLDAGDLEVAGALTASYGELSLACSGMKANLESGVIVASGPSTITDRSLEISIAATEATVNLKEKSFTARGGISADARQDGVTLTSTNVAGSFISSAGGFGEGQLEGSVIVLTGEPVVHYKESSFTGSKITLRRGLGVSGKSRTVIEVEGPQRAVLNLDALEEAQAKKANQ